MIKKLRSLHFNHLKKTFCCIACCFLLLFVSLPVNAADHHGGGRSRGEPVTDDQALYYTLGSMLFGAGVTLLDPDAYANNLPIFKQYYNSLDETDYRRELDSIIEHNKQGYSTIYDCTYDFWNGFETTFINWLNDYDSSLASNEYYFSVNPSSSGLVGFTADSLFSFYLPDKYDKNILINVDLGKSWLNIGVLDYNTISSLAPYLNAYNGNNLFSRLENPDNFCWVGSRRNMGSTGWNSASDGYLTKGTYSSVAGFSASYGFKIASPKYNFHYYLFFNNNTHNSYISSGRSCFVDSLGYVYDISVFGNVYAFVDRSDSTHIYNGLTFSSKNAALSWFASSCGLKVDFGTESSSGSSYSAHVTSNPLVYDVDSVTSQISLISDIISNSDDTSIPMILIGNDTDFSVMHNNPDYIFNPDGFDLIPLYPSNIPKINTKLDMWKRKFPFCIPFDFYTMLTSFCAEQEIPQFTFVAIPADSFGLCNDDLYLSIDFEPFDPIVQMLRFFLGLGFCVFLILSTKNFIK